MVVLQLLVIHCLMIPACNDLLRIMVTTAERGTKHRRALDTLILKTRTNRTCRLYPALRFRNFRRRPTRFRLVTEVLLLPFVVDILLCGSGSRFLLRLCGPIALIYVTKQNTKREKKKKKCNIKPTHGMREPNFPVHHRAVHQGRGSPGRNGLYHLDPVLRQLSPHEGLLLDLVQAARPWDS